MPLRVVLDTAHVSPKWASRIDWRKAGGLALKSAAIDKLEPPRRKHAGFCARPQVRGHCLQKRLVDFEWAQNRDLTWRPPEASYLVSQPGSCIISRRGNLEHTAPGTSTDRRYTSATNRVNANY